jgi:hypothetical protein
LNQHLSDVFNGTFPKIRYNFVTTNEIVNIINKLNMTNSFGYDEIPIKILKSSSYYISSPLTYIINRSLATGIFPDQLKFSEIILIYKKGDKNLISNCRPISILTASSQIFEVIYTRLYKHLVNNNILANEQFGFKANSSNDKATLSWKSHIDQLLPKLTTACYTIRTLKPYLSQETLLMVYYAYFYSVLNFGIIFWGNSLYAISIFRVQKRVLRIMTGT